MMMRIMMKEVRDMFGPYDDLFDFDHDGKMDVWKSLLKWTI